MELSLFCTIVPLNSMLNLDKIGEEDMRLTRFYMASAFGISRKAVFIKGCYPQRVSSNGNLGHKVIRQAVS